MESMASYFKALDEELQCYLDMEQIEKCYQAFLLAEKAHKGQMRRSGEPYITHPVSAAVILAEMRMDCQSMPALVILLLMLLSRGWARWSSAMQDVY